jgi:hypothetical protein
MNFASKVNGMKTCRKDQANATTAIAVPALVGGAALVLLGTVHSVFLVVVLLSFVAIGVYGFMGPFWALPREFLSGFSAAAGLALIRHPRGHWPWWHENRL